VLLYLIRLADRCVIDLPGCVCVLRARVAFWIFLLCSLRGVSLCVPLCAGLR